MNSLPKWVEESRYKYKIISLMEKRKNIVEKYLQGYIKRSRARKKVALIAEEIRELYTNG